MRAGRVGSLPPGGWRGEERSKEGANLLKDSHGALKIRKCSSWDLMEGKEPSFHLANHKVGNSSAKIEK